MSYISPMSESRDSSLKNKRFNSTNKLGNKDSFPNIKNKIKPKGFQSYLSSMSNLPTAINKMNSRKSRIVNKTQNFGINFTYDSCECFFIVIKTGNKVMETSQSSVNKEVSFIH